MKRPHQFTDPTLKIFLALTLAIANGLTIALPALSIPAAPAAGSPSHSKDGGKIVTSPKTPPSGKPPTPGEGGKKAELPTSPTPPHSGKPSGPSEGGKKTSPTPSASGRPKRRAAGGHRGQCPRVAIPLTAIVPLTEAQTLAERPTFWFYNPYDGVSLPAKFTLQLKGEIVTEMIMTLPATPGIVRVQLPNTVTLAVDQSYEWFLAVNCDKGQSSQPPIEVEGTVRRILPPTATLPAAKTLREQTAFYLTNGLWLDATTTLLEPRLTAPQASPRTAEWQTLLEAIDLKEFATTPVVPWPDATELAP